MTLVQTEPKSIKIGTTDIKRITIRPNGTEKQIRPAGWQPGANTILYLPLEGNLNTQGSYSVTVNTDTGSSFNTTSAGKTYLQQTNGRIFLVGASAIPQVKTINYWFYPVNTTSQTFGVCIGGTETGTLRAGPQIYTGVWSSKLLYDVFGTNGVEYGIFGTETTFLNKRNLYTLVYDNGTLTGYINGTYYSDRSAPNTLKQADYIVIGSNDTYCNQKISEIIIESTPRTAQEISDYYNLTKGNYGL